MLLERKVSRKEAIKFLRAVLHDPLIETVHADESIEENGFKLYQKYKDQNFSIVDCVSFVIMKEYGIKRAFTFDGHFSLMGFIIEPR